MVYEEILGRTYETVVGRLREDLHRHGTKASGFIGKHIVGTGEDAHLTTKVYIDLLKPHVILVCGKRGTGKSYAAGVIIEEVQWLEEEYASKLAIVVFDPIGIYWSMKLPNKAEEKLLESWELQPTGLEMVKVYVPFELKELYEKAGIPVDHAIKIAVKEFSAEDWILAFNLERTSEYAISLERSYNKLLEAGGDFGIDELIEQVKRDEQASAHVRNVLISFFEVAKGWGIFERVGMSIHDIAKPKQVSVIDLSRVRGEEWGIRNLLAAWITRQVYRQRILARKEEELAKVEHREPEKVFPLTWLIFEEAHNFIPADRETVSTLPILTIARQGREPGIGLMVITQMPNKVHPDVLAQTDLVFSFRLTSRADLDALHAVMQTYMAEEIWKHINRLPRWPGSCIVLDDNLEKVFTVQIRPRKSWHSGGTAAII
jgi:hypothetical protein